MNLRTSAKKVGDWAKIRLALSRLPTVVGEANKFNKEQATEFLNFLKDNVSGQRIDWTPLSIPYVKRKESLGLDHRTLIATGQYLEGLRVGLIGTNHYFVGAFAEDIHEPSGLSMSVLASYLENGTDRTPARPHIYPSWDMFQNTYKSRLSTNLKSNLSKIWR